MSEDRLDALVEQVRTRSYGRRDVLKRAAVLGLSAPAIATLLAACGDDDDPTPTTPPAAPDPTATSVPDDDDDDDEEDDTPAPTEAPDDDDDDDEDETPAPDPTATTPPAAPDPTATPEPPPPGFGGGIINLPVTTGDTGVGNPIIAGRVIPISNYVFSRLVFFDDEGSLQPDLAASWEFSADSLELTFNLASATWHDGEAFDVEDVLFTFEAIQDEATETFLRSRLRVGGEYMSWNAPDSSTIELTMVEPFAPVLFSLAQIPIIPEHLLAGSADINTDSFNQNPVGTGPMVLDEWVSDQFLRMTSNQDFHRGAPMSDGMTFFFMADSTAARAAFEAGEIDMFFTPPEAQAPFMDHPQYDLQRYVYFTPITLAFNHSHPILQDITVRRAVELAIDKVSMTDTVTRGLGIVAHNQYADTGPLDRYNDYDNVPMSEYDPDLANQMLDDAGYERGADGIRMNSDGLRFEFPILTYSGFDEYATGQVILQEMLGEIGIDLIPTIVEYTTLEGFWIDPDDDPLGRAMELHEWPHPFEFDPDVFNELHSANHPPGSNYMWFADDEIDDLIDRGRVETDPDARVALYHQIDQRRSETLPAIPLYLAVDAWVTSGLVLNRDGDPISSRYFRQFVVTDAWNWWKES